MKQASKIKYTLLCLVAFIMGAYIFLNAVPYAIMLYFVIWLIEGNFGMKMKTFLANRYALLFIVFYVLQIVGLIYTNNFSGGLFSLQVKFSLLLFPILLASEGRVDVKYQKRLMYAFIAGCLVNSLICLGNATWKYIDQGIFQFTYSKFSIFLHPSYFSMYIDLVLLFTYYLLTNSAAGLTKISRSFLTGLIFFFAFMLVLLQSKMGLIISSVLILTLLIRYALKVNYKQSGFALIVIAIVYFTSYHFMVTNGHSRFVTTIEIVKKTGVQASAIESTQARSLVWRAACQVIKRSPIIGYGTGGGDSVLVKQYLADGYTGVARERLNAHNQYLQTTVVLGVIGLLSLLACFLFPFIVSVKEHRFIYGAFLVIVAVNFLVEAMLETQSGTVFYGMFNSLLMFNFAI